MNLATWSNLTLAMILVLGACSSDDTGDTNGEGDTAATTVEGSGGTAVGSSGESGTSVGGESGTGSDGAPSTTGTTGSDSGQDASSSGHAGAAFGEPCHAPEDCASQICFLDQCSQTCESPADCPAPWTCDMGGAISICVLN